MQIPKLVATPVKKALLFFFVFFPKQLQEDSAVFCALCVFFSLFRELVLFALVLVTVG